MSAWSPQKGFSVVELIATIVIAGILAVSAMNVFSRKDYDASATAAQLRSIVSYGQKTAVAARRATRVSVASGALVLEVCQGKMSSTEVCPATSSWVALPGPGGTASFTPHSGVSLTLGTAINFDTLGRPTDAAGVPVTLVSQIQIVADTTVALLIEPETGYVHF